MSAFQPSDRQSDGHSWLEAGDGPETIIFLHPIVGTSIYWAPIMEKLSDRWRCLAWDAPGYRGTEPAEEPLAPAVTASLNSFLDVAGVRRCHVVGLSLGGMFALHAAASGIDRFDRMIVADTSAVFGIDPDEWLADWLGDLDGGMPLTEVVDASIGSITAVAPNAEHRAQIVASFADVPDAAFRTASKYIANHDVEDKLSEITNEMLVLVGEHDGETPPMYGEQIAAGVANGTFEQLPGLGHLTSFEDPDLFAAKIRSFLELD